MKVSGIREVRRVVLASGSGELSEGILPCARNLAARLEATLEWRRLPGPESLGAVVEALRESGGRDLLLVVMERRELEGMGFGERELRRRLPCPLVVIAPTLRPTSS
ncbi:MAG: hypothetical protein HQL56_11225 [Magnetococcales bacterium]|nr:hypothetical protein [Magnetococcales bacterium]